MYITNATTQACAQADAAKIQAISPPQTLDLQARKLLQRFAMAPELARAVAVLAFDVVEARP